MRLAPAFIALACSATAVTAAETSDAVPVQSAGQEMATIIVTAERLPSDGRRATSSIEVVDDTAIANRGQPLQVMDNLVAMPGVEVTSTGGGPGGPKTIILRGTRPSDTAILLDGVPLTDPAAPQSNPDLAYLLPAGLTRVEVVKGGQSGRYGSSAIGGVVNLIGPRPTADHQGSVLLEAGTYDTFRSEHVATGPLGGGIGYAVTLSGLSTGGWSTQSTPATPGDPDGFERDGFRRYGATVRLEAPLGPDLVAYLAGSLAAGRDEYDGFAAPDDSEQMKRLRADRLGAGLAGSFTGTDLAVDAANTRYRREYSGSFNQQYNGDELFVSARARREVQGGFSVNLGTDTKRSAIDIPDSFSDSDRNIGIYGGAAYGTKQDVFDATVRMDLHSREGDAMTFRLGAARFAWQERLKIHGSVATGFRAPSLYELYAPDDYGAGPIGNLKLKPQRNITFDIGQSIRPIPALQISTVYFRTEYDESIVYTGTYTNTGSGTSIDGVEAAVDFHEEGDPLTVRVFGTWQRSDDGDGQALAYVPVQSGGVDMTYDLPFGWWNITVKRTGYQYAGSNESERLEGRTLVNTVVGWRATTWLTLQARAENLTGVKYEAYRGFGETYPGSPRTASIAAVASW